MATKGGRGRPGDGSWTVHGDPRHLRRAAEGSATRLGVEAIGLYQLHKSDPAVPFADSVGALRDLADAGTIRMVGLSNVDRGQIRTAREILGPRLVSVQNRFSPAHSCTRDTLDLCTGLGLAFLPWSPLGGISLSAVDDPGTTAPTPDTPFHTLARAHGVSPQQICLAWHLAQSPAVIPIPGARRPTSIRDSAAAAALALTAAEPASLHLRSGADRPDTRSGTRVRPGHESAEELSRERTWRCSNPMGKYPGSPKALSRTRGTGGPRERSGRTR